MSEGTAPVEAGLTSKRLARLVSDTLKRMGFRYGAPLLRAEAHFSRADAMRHLGREVPNPINDLNFTVLNGGETIRMQLLKIQDCLLFESQLPEEVFGFGERLTTGGTYLLYGRLLKGSPRGFVHSEAYDPGEPMDPCAWWSQEDDRTMKVAAIVAFDMHGEAIGAIVQKVPSPAEELLYIPRT